MSIRSPKVRSALSAVAVVVAIAAAAVVWQNLPTPTDVLGPFDVHGEAGAAVAGRGISATVDSARVTPLVDSVQPAGVWIVVDAALTGTVSTELPHAKLVVGPNTYDPSDVFFGNTLMAEVSPGITWRGSWVFDVAPDLVKPDASEPVTLLVWVGDGRLDSRLVIDIPTHDSRFSRVDAVTLNEPKQSAS